MLTWNTEVDLPPREESSKVSRYMYIRYLILAKSSF